jgi:hypothetical protein
MIPATSGTREVGRGCSAPSLSEREYVACYKDDNVAYQKSQLDLDRLRSGWLGLPERFAASPPVLLELFHHKRPASPSETNASPGSSARYRIRTGGSVKAI